MRTIYSIQPLPEQLEQKGQFMFCYNNKQEEVDYWNALANKNVVIYTSQCSSFFVNSKAAEEFLKP